MQVMAHLLFVLIRPQKLALLMAFLAILEGCPKRKETSIST